MSTNTPNTMSIEPQCETPTNKSIEHLKMFRNSLRGQMIQLRAEIAPIESTLLALKEQYREACAAYDRTDRELAELDGRLQIISAKPAVKPLPSEEASLRYLNSLSPTELSSLIERLELKLS
jgi:hypothetical protein